MAFFFSVSSLALASSRSRDFFLYLAKMISVEPGFAYESFDAPFVYGTSSSLSIMTFLGSGLSGLIRSARASDLRWRVLNSLKFVEVMLVSKTN